MKQTFTTTDISLAAALITGGAPIPQVEKYQQDRAQFTFVIDKEHSNLRDCYYSRNLLVDAYTMHSNIRLLKAMTREELF